MDRRIFTTGLLAAPLLAVTPPAMAAGLSLDQIEKYLEGFKTAQANFVQTNPNGSKDKGTLYISRPGKIRFDYKPPNEALVVVSGGAIAIRDGRSNSAAKQYPVGKSPIGFLLKKDIKLAGNSAILKHSSDDKYTYITAHDPKEPRAGRIQLAFANDKIRLVQWVTTDQSGKKTRVNLGKMKTGHKIPAKLFNREEVMGG